MVTSSFRMLTRMVFQFDFLNWSLEYLEATISLQYLPAWSKYNTYVWLHRTTTLEANHQECCSFKNLLKVNQTN